LLDPSKRREIHPPEPLKTESTRLHTLSSISSSLSKKLKSKQKSFFMSKRQLKNEISRVREMLEDSENKRKSSIERMKKLQPIYSRNLKSN
jgi:hypothetical protein